VQEDKIKCSEALAKLTLSS